MIHAFATLVMGLFLSWHQATEAECSAEFDREIQQFLPGERGDPPISMGIAEVSWGNGHSVGRDDTPCGYSNGIDFRTKYSAWRDDYVESFAPGYLLYWERERTDAN